MFLHEALTVANNSAVITLHGGTISVMLFNFMLFVCFYNGVIFSTQTIQDMMKQARAGRSVLEDDIPPPVAVSSASDHRPADVAARQTPSSTATRQPAPASATHTIEIPRPSVISATAPVPKPRTNVSQPSMDQLPAIGAGGPGISVAKAAVNAPPVQLHTGPTSDRPANTGNLTASYVACSSIINVLIRYCYCVSYSALS